MADGIYSALSGAVSQARALEVTANNLANATSTGFKRDRVAFREVLAAANVVDSPENRQVVADLAQTDFSQGAIRHTGNPLDVALLGDGFFAVKTPQGERYTRTGTFTLNPERRLTTLNGHSLLGVAGEITVGELSDIRIAKDGMVWSGNEAIGQLRVVRFGRPDQLVREGEGLWRGSRGARMEEQEPHLEPGSLERSNVNPIQGMSELVTASRAYEIFHKVISTFRKVDERAATEIGR